MNIEDYRNYCLSLGDVEEKLPFAKMPGGDSILAFYVQGHTFCYCDLESFHSVIVKCQTERIPELMENQGIFPPDNHFNSKYWIGINPHTVSDDLLKDLTRNSYEIVKAKYTKKKTKN